MSAEHIHHFFRKSPATSDGHSHSVSSTSDIVRLDLSLCAVTQMLMHYKGLLEMPANGLLSYLSIPCGVPHLACSSATPHRREQVFLHVAHLVGSRFAFVRVCKVLRRAACPPVRHPSYLYDTSPILTAVCLGSSWVSAKRGTMPGWSIICRSGTNGGEFRCTHGMTEADDDA